MLVRHGQATPFEADTDRLSKLGRRQAAALAAHWIARDIDVDQVVTGGLRRQRDTATAVADGMRAADRPWPDATIDRRFDEYDGDGVFTTLAAHLADRDPEVAVLRERAAAARGTDQQNRHFQRLVERVADHWQRGEVADDDVEPWGRFAGRVDAAVARLRAGRSGRRVVVVTSGGVIGRIVQRALDAPDTTALALNWRIENCSLTRLTFSRDRMSLDTFNTTAHLDEARLRSFR